MKKFLKKIQDPRIVLAITGILMAPAFVCSVFLGWIPDVARWIMYVGVIPFTYLTIMMFIIPVGGWIFQAFKWIKDKIKKQ